MGRKYLYTFLVLVTVLLCLCTIPVYCDENGNPLLKQLDNIDTGDIQKFVDELNHESSGYLPDMDVKSMIKGLFQGNPITNVKKIFAGLGKYMIREVVQNFTLMGQIIILAVFCAILQNLHGAFEGESVGRLAYNICYILIIILAVKSFYTAAALSASTIERMTEFTQALLPTLMALLVSVGGIASSAVFQPVIFGSISVITTFIKSVIIPLIFFSAVLSILDNMSETIRISRLASLLKNVSLGILGVILTVFAGIVSIQGVAASSLDGVAVKTGKFAVDNFIPIVGGFLKDAFEAVVSCSLLIKNGVGLAGLLILLLICSFPLIKLFSIIVIYKLSSALIQPIMDNQVVQCLNDISNSLLVLLACVIAVGAMFLIAIAVIVGVGNSAAMVG